MAFIDSIKNYKDYLEFIKNWDLYSELQQEQLKKWYRNYYTQNKESERLRYRIIMLTIQKKKKNDYKSTKKSNHTVNCFHSTSKTSS
jgi:hypothetical protein